MKFLSVCSGIEAASVAWEPLGWEAVAFSEIEKFPSAVIAHHWPDVPNLGDMTKYNEWKLRSSIDLLVGGTPCQAFSVAGLRQGLADPRGNLTLTFLAMVEKFKPRWVVWENVPGVLSDKTNAFGQFLAGLGELGYEYAYRVLDAQHFGVPQRRRRVFVVASIGTVHPAAVLFEPESLCRDLTPSREKGEGTTYRAKGGSHWSGGPHPALASANKGSGGIGMSNQEIFSQQGGGLVPDVANCIQTTCGDYSRADGFNMIPTPIQNATRGKSQNGLGIGKENAPMFTLDQASQHAIAFDPQGSGKQTTLGNSIEGSVCQAMQVRRLTPTECERLQGFPDGHTLIPYRNKPAEDCPDGPRYKALGNSMAVPVMRWIGQRIAGLHNV